MTLTELILAVGDDNVRFQNLDQCAAALDWSRKSGSKITFVTPETIIPGEGTERLGLVVWLDRKALADAVANATQAGSQTLPASDGEGDSRPNPESTAP